MNKFIYLSIFTLLFFPILCQAVSFDCRYVKKDTLKMICNSPELSKLDDELMVHYKHFEKRLASISEDSKQLFQNMIKQGLNSRDQCQDEACLIQWYKNYIKFYVDAEKDFSKQEEQAHANSEIPSDLLQEVIPVVDSHTTSKAPWAKGAVILRGTILDNYGKSMLNVERRYLGSNRNGDYWIQEFFSDTGLKYTSPYLWPQKKCDTRPDKGEIDRHCYEGELIIYAENGKQPLWLLVTKKGREDGPWRRWYNNGNPMYIGQYCKGVQCGVWTQYHENGIMQSQGAYYNNYLRKGVWKFWDKEGKQVNEIDYKDKEDPFANGELPLFGE